MTNPLSGTSDPAKHATPAERLQWWKAFDYPVYELSVLIPIAEPQLQGLLPPDRQQAFQSACVTLQNVAAALHNDHIKKVINALEQGKEPPVPDVPLPDVPPWNPNQPQQNKFHDLLNAMIPFVQVVSQRVGQDSDVGLAILELFSAADGVATQLQAVAPA